jgi:hypothetical protein
MAVVEQAMAIVGQAVAAGGAGRGVRHQVRPLLDSIFSIWSCERCWILPAPRRAAAPAASASRAHRHCTGAHRIVAVAPRLTIISGRGGG